MSLKVLKVSKVCTSIAGTDESGTPW